MVLGGVTVQVNPRSPLVWLRYKKVVQRLIESIHDPKDKSYRLVQVTIEGEDQGYLKSVSIPTSF